MKIVQALKEIKLTLQQIADLQQKVRKYSSDEDDQNPIYTDVVTQTKQVRTWLQTIEDLSDKIEQLYLRIQLTNLSTKVVIKIGDKSVTKTISAWIKWRQSLADIMKISWASLKENTGRAETRVIKDNDGKEKVVKVRRYWSPEEKDKMEKMYNSMALTIDGTLEVINAETDLMELPAM